METYSLGKAKDFLDEIAANLKAYGYQTRVATTLGTPVEGILQEAKALNPDLILADPVDVAALPVWFLAPCPMRCCTKGLTHS